MSISAPRDQLSKQVLAFAWSQWAQMGLLTQSDRDDRWATDPEALLLFTLEVARDDPRLFDEVLDWLLVNEKLISVQRLRNLAQDSADRVLIEASLAWTTGKRSPARRVDLRRSTTRAAVQAAPLFRTTTTKVKTPDEAFQRHGLIRAQLDPSGKSRAPQLRRPISFAFRLRALLGVGARAEAVRILLGSATQALSVHEITKSAAYAKRNVQEALTSLHAAGVIQAATSGNERRYSIEKDHWAQLLDLAPDALPEHRDWIALLDALRHLTRWLTDPENEKLSDYMRASRARELIEALSPSLRSAGAHVSDYTSTGADYWPDFENAVNQVAHMLRP